MKTELNKCFQNKLCIHVLPHLALLVCLSVKQRNVI
jgi:hypothetical protein